MRTITPFQQLLNSEIQRIRSAVAPQRIATHPYTSFAAHSNRYTIEYVRTNTTRKTKKGLLARIFG